MNWVVAIGSQAYSQRKKQRLTSQTKRVRRDSSTVLATAPMLSVTNMPVTLYIISEKPATCTSELLLSLAIQTLHVLTLPSDRLYTSDSWPHRSSSVMGMHCRVANMPKPLYLLNACQRFNRTRVAAASLRQYLNTSGRADCLTCNSLSSKSWPDLSR